MPLVITIIDRVAFDAAGILGASLEGDNMEIRFRDGGRIESWGEHGPNDFAQYGLRVQWLHPDDMAGHIIINGSWVSVRG